MDVDCGFDIFPRLDAADEADRPAYQQFLGEIIDTYKDPHGEKGSWEERKVLQLPAGDSGGELSGNNYIYFTVGEWPKIPANPKPCDYFLRFGSKFSRSLGYVEPYIRNVYWIAEGYFGDRVRW